MDFPRWAMGEFEQLCEQAIHKFGSEPQLRHTQEELAELSVAISHFVRARPGSIDEVAEELVDVEIMLGQLRVLVPPELLESWRVTKLEKLRRKVAGERRSRWVDQNGVPTPEGAKAMFDAMDAASEVGRRG